MDIKDWAEAIGLVFVFNGDFDPRKNSGYINVYLKKGFENMKLEVGKNCLGRSGHGLNNLFSLDEAISDLAKQFSEQTIIDGNGFVIEAPVLTYDGTMMPRPPSTLTIPKITRIRKI